MIHLNLLFLALYVTLIHQGLFVNITTFRLNVLATIYLSVLCCRRVWFHSILSIHDIRLSGNKLKRRETGSRTHLWKLPYGPWLSWQHYNVGSVWASIASEWSLLSLSHNMFPFWVRGLEKVKRAISNYFIVGNYGIIEVIFY